MSRNDALVLMSTSLLGFDANVARIRPGPARKSLNRQGGTRYAGGLDIEIIPVDPDGDQGLLALRSYFHDVASSYYHRSVTDAEVVEYMQEDPSSDLIAPSGVFLVAVRASEVLGCIGLRFGADGIGVVTRVFVPVPSRGQGLGSRLMDEMELRARQHGLTRLRLDTRHDLVAARRLYARHGFVEIPPFSTGEFAEHWFEKVL
jgi:ribosomal protein S18 acetylase RimI-like enzyme